MNTENSTEKGKPINLSQATVAAKISIDKNLVKKYDIYAKKAKLVSLVIFIMTISFIAMSGMLFSKGHWGFAIITVIFSLFGFFLTLMFRGISSGGAFESGLLVGGIITNISPLEMVVLANISNSENDEVQYACKKIKPINLPLHKIKLGERIPCAAMFGGVRDGIHLNFQPRPLSWATSDITEIKAELEKIDSSDWEFLELVKNKIPKLDDEQIALFDLDGKFMEIK